MKNNVSTFKVAATYIGTVVGAGFATGQEVLQFFNRFGAMGTGRYYTCYKSFHFIRIFNNGIGQEIKFPLPRRNN